MSESFRKLDVDQYDPDRVPLSDIYPSHPSSSVLSDARSKLQDVRGFIQRGDVGSALGRCLEDPPYGDREGDRELQEAKATALEAVLFVLNSTKSTDIPQLVAAVPPFDQVTLMKYLYKAMENLGDSNGNAILGWHERLVEHAGTGVIVRVMTDRKRV